ncbi:group II intron reverse transcriptase/maturase [Rhizobium sp. SG570]|uniref:group II intron reverse transcriptase/maturase n=1 Tax=Rhizobium sp. SG570 TaxID=2587113 RepID=UPI001445DD18|nr:group II intron reverse transcriptase/maturase [Rhizobium sp. SG570]
MDMDYQADEAWVLGVQRKLYQQSKANPDEAWRDLWGWLTDARMIRHAWRRVSTNKGRRSAGVDGITVDRVRQRIGEQTFLDGIRRELRSGAYQPSPSRRKLIPKPGKPGQFRPLGIPTVKDRVVQGAVKAVLEPIFEAQFWPVSYGFRPGKSTHGALEHIRLSLLPRKRDEDSRRHQMPYNWIIEGDIKGCFDNINHHHLMERLRARVADRLVMGLVGQFLKAGVLAEDQFLRTDNGTPQGGIISPLLANIALSAIEERYERWTYHRTKIRKHRLCNGAAAALSARGRDRRLGRCVFFPIRYADDFVVLVSGSKEDAIAEKSALADYLRRTTGLELSPEKTRITAVTEGFEFLGFHVAMRWDKRYGYFPRIEIPKAKAADLRHKIKVLTKVDTNLVTLGQKLDELNLILRGWAGYYRHCARAGKVFTAIDWFVTRRIWCWLRKKRRKARVRDIMRSFGPSRRRLTRRLWQEGLHEQYILAWTPIRRFLLGWMKTPNFAMSSGEPDA